MIDHTLFSPSAKESSKAIDIEMDNIVNNIWMLVLRFEANSKAIIGIWYLEETLGRQLKVKWCARRILELFVDDTYTDILPTITVRISLTFAASQNLPVRHANITAAFLIANIYLPTYTELPHSKEKTGNLICKLNKAIY